MKSYLVRLTPELFEYATKRAKELGLPFGAIYVRMLLSLDKKSYEEAQKKQKINNHLDEINFKTPKGDN